MGALYLFTCKCGYQAEVSGGPDRGMASSTVTICCSTCKKLRDVTIGSPWDDPPAPVSPHPTCPSSRTRVHHTELWRHPGPCPRCGARMKRGPETVLWD